MENLKVGVKVLCLTEPGLYNDEIDMGCVSPKAGEIYTVREVLHNNSAILLEEIKNPVKLYTGGVSAEDTKPVTGEPLWGVKHFQVL